MGEGWPPSDCSLFRSVLIEAAHPFALFCERTGGSGLNLDDSRQCADRQSYQRASDGYAESENAETPAGEEASVAVMRKHGQPATSFTLERGTQ